MSAPVRRAPGDVLTHLRRARDHIDAHYAEPLDLATIAEVAGVSKYHPSDSSSRRTASRRPST